MRSRLGLLRTTHLSIQTISRFSYRLLAAFSNTFSRCNKSVLLRKRGSGDHSLQSLVRFLAPISKRNSPVHGRYFRSLTQVSVLVTTLFAINAGKVIGVQPALSSTTSIQELTVNKTPENFDVQGVVAIASVTKRVGLKKSEGEDSIINNVAVDNSDIDPRSPEFQPEEFTVGILLDSAGHLLCPYRSLGDIERKKFFAWSTNSVDGRVQIVPVVEILAADPWTDWAVLKLDSVAAIPATLNMELGTELQLALERQLFGKLEKATLTEEGSNKKNETPSDFKKFYLCSQPQRFAAEGAFHFTEVSLDAANLVRVRRNEKSDRVSLDDAPPESLYDYGGFLRLNSESFVPGSTGWILDESQRVVGVAYRQSADGRIWNGNFFDQTDQRAIEILKKGELPEFGMIGISAREVSSEAMDRKMFGISVYQVVKNSPADRAGIHFSDIVTSWNDKQLIDVDDFLFTVGGAFAGDEIEIDFLRGVLGSTTPKTEKIRLTLGKRFVASRKRPIAKYGLEEWRGIRVDFPTATPNFATESTNVNLDGCVGVISLAPEAIGSHAGLRVGQFITHVNDVRIRTPAEFYREARKVSRSTQVKLTLSTAGGKVAMPIEIPPESQ